MRIVHTCLRYPPATGGVERYVQEIVERTRDIDAGRDVRVLSSRMRTHGPITELAPEALLDDPPYLQRLHHLATPLISYPRLQALAYYLAHHEPTIIHGHSFWYQPADVAARFAKRHGLPFVFNPYYYEHAQRQAPHWQLYKHTRGRATFAAADAVIVISPFEQRLIEQAGFPVKRFELIPPGVDSAQFDTPQPDPYQKRGITGSIILSVSRVSAGKGIDEVIAALPEIRRSVPDVQLVIVGEDFGAQAALRQQSEQLGVADSIHFLGRLSDSELIGAYQHAAVLVHPSHYEAFGIVLAESLAAGTPVVARNTAAIPFVVPHERAGLLFETSEELSRHLIAVLTNQTLRDKLAAQGKQHVVQNFTWDAAATKLIALYEEVTAAIH